MSSSIFKGFNFFNLCRTFVSIVGSLSNLTYCAIWNYSINNWLKSRGHFSWRAYQQLEAKQPLQIDEGVFRLQDTIWIWQVSYVSKCSKFEKNTSMSRLGDLNILITVNFELFAWNLTPTPSMSFSTVSLTEHRKKIFVCFTKMATYPPP